jgi:hypothetical protein
LPAKSGNYVIKVEAKDARGANIETSSIAQARIIGVSFEGGEPTFLIGDAHHQEKVTMKNIVKVDDVGGVSQTQAPSAGAQPAPGGIQPVVNTPAQHFFSFKKGEGSENLDPSVDPIAKEALEKFQAKMAAERGEGPTAAVAGNTPNLNPSSNQAQAKSAPVESGFPNGLHDSLDNSGSPASPNPNEKGKP